MRISPVNPGFDGNLTFVQPRILFNCLRLPICKALYSLDSNGILETITTIFIALKVHGKSPRVYEDHCVALSSILRLFACTTEPEHIASKFIGLRCFYWLDLRDASLHNPLQPACRELLTFNTPFCLYSFSFCHLDKAFHLQFPSR